MNIWTVQQLLLYILAFTRRQYKHTYRQSLLKTTSLDCVNLKTDDQKKIILVVCYLSLQFIWESTSSYNGYQWNNTISKVRVFLVYMNGLVLVKRCVSRLHVLKYPHNPTMQRMNVGRLKSNNGVPSTPSENIVSHTDTAACFASRSSAVTKYNAVQKLYRHPVYAAYTLWTPFWTVPGI